MQSLGFSQLTHWILQWLLKPEGFCSVRGKNTQTNPYLQFWRWRWLQCYSHSSVSTTVEAQRLTRKRQFKQKCMKKRDKTVNDKELEEMWSAQMVSHDPRHRKQHNTTQTWCLSKESVTDTVRYKVFSVPHFHSSTNQQLNRSWTFIFYFNIVISEAFRHISWTSLVVTEMA